ncbi:MAG: pilus assembly protein PilP [Desulfobacter sp.]|nr:pilus assembly protein PilP [Desulfobacter sp.]WDP85074.1 MAG: pilus assembly protein PilP [Desulfobacter sp.]
MAKFIKIFCVTGLGMLLFCLISCKEEKKTQPPQKPVLVVSKSIGQPTPSAKGKDNLVTDQVKADEKNGAAKSSGVKAAMPGLVAIPLNPKDKMAKVEPVVNEESVTYDTRGWVDPFVPLFSEKEEPISGEGIPGQAGPEKSMRQLTPLEKMDLSQIKLVAVIELRGSTIAMVEEASGKGYEVKLGTYIGRNQGRVSAIHREGIVVKEYVKDYKGNRKERLQEIKFHKSEGGE